MCGIVGIVGKQPVNQALYDGLTMLQHRGQDAAGIMTVDEYNTLRLRKANGLVRDVFHTRHMHRLPAKSVLAMCVTQPQAAQARRRLNRFTSTRLLALPWHIMAI